MKPALRALLAQRKLAPYLGQIATRCVASYTFDATNQESMSRTRHYCTEDVTRLQLVFPNWQSIATATGSNATISASIEYPAGTFTRVTFSGSNDGTITDGDYLVSDPVSVSILRGQTFYVRSFYRNASGMLYYSNGMNTSVGEACAYGTTGTVTDQVMAGTITHAGRGYVPIAIIGNTRQPSFLILGDSRAFGGGGYDGSNMGSGDISPSIDRANYAWSNVAVGGYSASTLAASGTTSTRARLGVYFSHIISAHGGGDNLNGRTPAQVLADQRTIQSFYNGKPFFLTTVYPKTTSTDSWATLENQTLDANNTNRVDYNNLVRARPVGVSGYIELCDLYESSRDSGKWGANTGYTTDGLHATSTGWIAMLNSGAVNPTTLAREIRS